MLLLTRMMIVGSIQAGNFLTSEELAVSQNSGEAVVFL
jgi:hypothetical protein